MMQNQMEDVYVAIYNIIHKKYLRLQSLDFMLINFCK